MDGVTGLNEWIADLDRAQSKSLPAVDAVVAKGALNVKKGAAKRIEGHPHAPAYPAAISYDTFHTPGTSRAEIGPDKGKRQGALGNILEFGTVNNPPIPHLVPALDEEGPRFENAIGDLGVRLLDG